MALFGGNKKNKKTANKTSAAQRLGLNVSKVPTQEEEIEKGLHDNVLRAYGYLRGRIDKGARHYYSTGSFDKLEEFVARPALDLMCDRLQTLRSANIYWELPNREETTQPDPRVIASGLKLDAEGRPIEFVVEERFLDYSVHKRLTDDGKLVVDAEAPGTPRAIQSRVLVTNGTGFKLVEVIAVQGATF
jgi:hypothetical protein